MDAENEKLSAARALHRAGNLAAAEVGYRALTAEAPDFAKPWWLLGLLAHQQGRVADAVICLQRAIDLRPSASWLVHLGNACFDGADYLQAANHYRHAIQLDETAPQAQRQLGMTLARLDELSAAAASLRAAIRQQPHDEAAWSELVRVLRRAGQTVEAGSEAEQWRAAMPSCVAAIAVTAEMELTTGDAQSAAELYGSAIRLAPNLAALHFNLGAALYLAHDLPAAKKAFESAIGLDPKCVDAYAGLASCHEALGEVDQARRVLLRAAEARPDFPLAMLRAKCVMPEVFQSVDELDTYRSELLTELDRLEDSCGPLSLAELEAARIYPPAALMYHGLDDRPIKERFARILEKSLRAEDIPSPTGKPQVGFVVTRGHEGVFAKGTRGLLRQWNQVESDAIVFCAASGQKLLEQEFSGTGCRIVTLLGSVEEMVGVLRAAKLDLLYFWEIGSDVTNYLLPLARCAPVQVASWGWPVTSGMRSVDVFLSSRLLEPAHAAMHYVERLIELSCLPNVYERPRTEHIAVQAELLRRAENERIYYCPQNPLKIHPDMDEVLRAILETDSRGIIALLESSRTHVTSALKRRLESKFASLAGRVRWLPRMAKDDYLRALAAADVVLDTLHYGGGANSTYDALALGVPFVTLPTEFHRGRYAAGVCKLLDLPQLVASSPAEYVRIATELANNPQRRVTVGKLMQERSDMIFADRTSARAIQTTFLQLVADARAR
jgi:tetratricopeptide (TPR) repeat protein